jgi:hypothetical protein
MGSYAEAAVRSRGKRAADGSQSQSQAQDQGRQRPGPGALPRGSGAPRTGKADTSRRAAGGSKESAARALTVPAWGLHGRNHAAAHHRDTQAQASRQPERESRR